MRCVFANPARNLAPHSDVISRRLGERVYAPTMRLITALLCSFFLLAILFGLAHSERSPNGAHADTLHAQPLIQDALCGEGSGHGTCQLVFPSEPVLVTLMAVAGSSHFEITPVMGSSRSLAPHTPPPRYVF